MYKGSGSVSYESFAGNNEGDVDGIKEEDFDLN